MPRSLFGNPSHSMGGFGLRPNATSLFGRLSHESDPGSGIIPHVALAAEAWKMARAYAAYQVGPDELPPWDPRSDYSLIMLRHMELDVQYPLKYRFATNNFGAISRESLDQRRDYWGPWLFQQFAYAAVPSLVNHPFLLSMRLKNFRHMMPQTFIHQSFDHISRNSAWLMYYLDLIEKQRFEVSDPLLAHCVVIVATIHLQHSFVKEDTLRQKAQNGYNKCLGFLDRMGLIWPCVFSMAQNLRKLQGTIRMVSHDTSQEDHSTDPHRSWTIDAKLLWDILIYERAGQPTAAADRSMFGERITLEDHPEQDITKFAMMGSAGISGHRTVAKEVVAYAPDNEESSDRLNPSSTPTAAPVDSVEITDGGLFDASGYTSQIVDGNSSFLQPVDFGAAIRNWFDFDMSY